MLQSLRNLLKLPDCAADRRVIHAPELYIGSGVHAIVAI